MEEIIERMKTLVLAETPKGESYSQKVLDAMREDDETYFEILGK